MWTALLVGRGVADTVPHTGGAPGPLTPRTTTGVPGASSDGVGGAPQNTSEVSRGPRADASEKAWQSNTLDFRHRICLSTSRRTVYCGRWSPPGAGLAVWPNPSDPNRNGQTTSRAGVRTGGARRPWAFPGSGRGVTGEASPPKEGAVGLRTDPDPPKGPGDAMAGRKVAPNCSGTRARRAPIPGLKISRIFIKFESQASLLDFRPKCVGGTPQAWSVLTHHLLFFLCASGGLPDGGSALRTAY